MKKNINRLFLLMFLAVNQAYGQYNLKKYTINNGGGKMTGGVYEMNSSIGQVDASNLQTGGNYSLRGGYWQQKTPQAELIFENGFE